MAINEFDEIIGFESLMNSATWFMRICPQVQLTIWRAQDSMITSFVRERCEFKCNGHFSDTTPATVIYLSKHFIYIYSLLIHL